MYLPKIGMITFSDPREHEFHVLYEKKTEVRMQKAKEYLEKMPVDCIPLTNQHVPQMRLMCRQMN